MAYGSFLMTAPVAFGKSSKVSVLIGPVKKNSISQEPTVCSKKDVKTRSSPTESTDLILKTLNYNPIFPDGIRPSVKGFRSEHIHTLLLQ
jgi:hypothetical protein